MLRQRASDRRGDPGKRSEERRAHAARRERVAQRCPGDARFHRNVAVGLVDLDDPVEAAHVDQDRIGAGRQIAVGVGGAAAAGVHGNAGRGRGAHGELQILHGRGPHHGEGQRARAIDIRGHADDGIAHDHPTGTEGLDETLREERFGGGR